MRIKNNYLFFSLILIFFISGFSALLYQVVWQRLLGLFSGSDVRSVTIVISAFLGGLGLGSLLGAMIADRLNGRQAIRLFGYCNLGIAAFALISRWLYYDLLFLRLSALSQSATLLLIIAFVSLLWPTILMGLSLPLLSRAIVRNVAEAARRITLLDGVNTVGAGLGALVAGWYLVGTFGYDSSLWIGAGLSGLVGVIALLLAGQFSAEREPEREGDGKKGKGGIPVEVWGWCFLAFTSGFMAISLELIWFRILDVSLKSNAYTFAYILAFFLVGDGVGSLLAIRFLPYIQRPRRLFFTIMGVVSLTSLAGVWLALKVAEQYAPIATYLRQTEGLTAVDFTAPPEQWLIYLLFPTLLMFIPALLIGFYFPVAQQAIQQDYASVGQRVGLIKLANIAGNAGSGIITGLVLLHFLGVARSIQLIGGLGLLFVALAIWENGRAGDKFNGALSGALAAVLLAVLVTFPNNQQIWATLHGAQENNLFLVAEDSTGVAAIRQDQGPAIVFANGQSQATIPFLSLHGLLGALPALTHPQPEQALIIGIGSAGTPYAAGVNPLTRRITAVEIIGSELDVLRLYRHHPGGEPLGHFFDDPRYEIVVGDGRRELNLTTERYDIIQADAIRPTGSHSGLLYSREFFQAASDKLAVGGLMAQWRATDRVEATFTAVFPYVINVGNFILLGSNQPIVYDPQQILQRLDEPEIAAYLRQGSYNPDEMRPWIEAPPIFWTPDTPRPNEPLNTDLRPRDEYYLNDGR